MQRAPLGVRPTDHPRYAPLTRRALVSAASACLLSGCTRTSRVPATLAPAGGSPLTVADAILYRLAGPIEQAWSRGHRRLPLQIMDVPHVEHWFFSGIPRRYGQMAPASTFDTAADILGISDYLGTDQHMQPLDEYLRTAGFNPNNLMRQALAPWSLPLVGLTALPFRLSEIQFYVNESVMGALGVPMPAQWSLAAMEAALEHAAARRDVVGESPLIAGLPWTDLELWGAFAVGLTGGPVGAPSFQSGPVMGPGLTRYASATAKLAALAARYGWTVRQAPDTAHFVQNGFAGLYAATLFAFMPPWDVPVEDISYAWPNWPAVEALTPSAFPALPKQAVVPAYRNFGLALSAYAKQPLAAVEFLVWLYDPPQQRMFMDLGVPPAVASQDLRAYWQLAQRRQPPGSPLFDPDRYSDILALLPAWGPQIPALMNYSQTISQDLAAEPMPEDVASDLTTAQQAYQGETELHLGSWP